MNPEHEAKAMERAVRWAICSAHETTTPVLTTHVLLVLPNWAGTAYLRWMSQPTVQEIQSSELAATSRTQSFGPLVWITQAIKNGM